MKVSNFSEDISKICLRYISIFLIICFEKSILRDNGYVTTELAKEDKLYLNKNVSL